VGAPSASARVSPRGPWSRRASFSLAENRLAALYAGARADASDVDDLTCSNPTKVALHAPAELARLVAVQPDYDPDPLGPSPAREAIAAFARGRGRSVDPARIVLSASTSEAYAWLLKLLCDPGDDVLVPSPSYPLFDYLAALESVALARYPLDRREGFRVDVDAVARLVGPRTRAIVVVAPNNPTGTLVRRDDAQALDALAADRGLALVVDEVFADWLHGVPAPALLPSFAAVDAHAPRALTFVLGGLSKLACAPQLKLAWTSVHGPEPLAKEALARLELVADTFLSVNAPVARALPALLAAQPRVADELGARLAANLAALDAAIAMRGAPLGVRRPPAHGGWAVLVEVPRVHDEDAWVRLLASHARVLVQPGWFFDLDDGGTLVVSLLAPPERFAPAVDRLLDVVAREVA